MASMLRISASPLLPPSHFPFSASFFRPPPVSSFFYGTLKLYGTPGTAGGVLYNKLKTEGIAIYLPFLHAYMCRQELLIVLI